MYNRNLHCIALYNTHRSKYRNADMYMVMTVSQRRRVNSRGAGGDEAGILPGVIAVRVLGDPRVVCKLTSKPPPIGQ